MPSSIDRFEDDYYFLSLFFQCKIRYDDDNWCTAEHAFQASKTNSLRDRDEILSDASAGRVRRFGNTLTPKPTWNDQQLFIMKNIQRAKFANPELRKQLLNTNYLELVYNNDHGDVFWGVSNRTGENHLGKILMDIRAELMESVAKEVCEQLKNVSDY